MLRYRTDELPAPDSPEVRELERVYKGKATWADCPKLLEIFDGDADRLEYWVRWLTDYATKTVLETPRLRKRAPYELVQYLAMLGQSLNMANPRDWERQCDAVVKGVKYDGVVEFHRLSVEAGLGEPQVVRRRAAAVWANSTSAQFTRNHEKKMFQALVYALHEYAAPPEECSKQHMPEGTSFLWAAALAALLAGIVHLVFGIDAAPLPESAVLFGAF